MWGIYANFSNFHFASAKYACFYVSNGKISKKPNSNEISKRKVRFQKAKSKAETDQTN